MPTKTEYRAYIASEAWQARRKEHLGIYPECNHCKLERWLAVIAYDQDLHVHHKSYANVGSELEEDLESLCRRCHEIETYGVSSLHETKSFDCPYCGCKSFNLYQGHLHTECIRELEIAKCQGLTDDCMLLY